MDSTLYFRSAVVLSDALYLLPVNMVIYGSYSGMPKTLGTFKGILQKNIKNLGNLSDPKILGIFRICRVCLGFKGFMIYGLGFWV